MQGSLFIDHHYLGVQRRKIGVLNQNMLKNKKQALSDHVPCAGRMCASSSPSCANFVVFVHFRSFFRLAIPWSLKWIFFTLYCIQIPFKNHWYLIFIPSILHLVSCFSDIHDFSLKRHKTPMAKTIHKVNQTIDNSSKWLLIFLQIQRK